MKKEKKNEHPTQTHLRERLSRIAKAVQLAGSLIILFFGNLRRTVAHGCRAFYYDHMYRRLTRPRAAFASLRRSRLQLMSLIMLFVLVLPMFSLMRVGVVVKVDGRVLGYVENQNEVQMAVQALEAESSEVLGEPFHLGADVSFEVAVTTPDSFITPDELPAAIAQNVDSLGTIAVVKIDGETVGACAEETQAAQVLDELREEAAQGDADAKTEFVQDVKVETLQAPTELLISQEDLKSKLLETKTEAQVYVVGEDDTMTSIAREHGMLRDDLLALNPDVIPERMAPGSTVILEAAVPTLSVKVVRTVDYTEDIAFDTIEKGSDSLAKGKENVIQQGATGLAAVTAEIVEIDGEEQERNILSRTVTLAPVDEIVEIGTKNIGLGTGSLIAPVSGTMTSGYKYRWGRMHKGIDYGLSVGSTVRAADNGRVIVSEYSRSGYGYYIIIDHGNGMKTLYAHNSQLLVNVGDTVEQGQSIALSGNTGNSTGPHCHFEVMIDGENVNPANYL